MKMLLGMCVAVVVLAAAAKAEAGSRQVGEISNTQLASLGLGDMERISDVQGLNIRGKARGQITIRFPATPKGFVNVFVPGVPVPIFFPERYLGILAR